MRKTVDLSAGKPNLVLRFLYNTIPGRIVLKGLIQPPVSQAIGALLSTSPSKCLIQPFVRRNEIDLSRYEGAPYPDYNSFFSRGIRPDQLHIAEGLIAPCDSKLTAYPIGEDLVFRIKGSAYSLPEMLEDDALASEFSGGTCLIFRLEVKDYHRYCYFDDCEEISFKKISGELHTVQPVAIHQFPVYHRNSREVTVMNTDHFGKAVQVEVGALCVGKIANHHRGGKHLRGEEKGRFLFGGSTVILLVKNAQLDPEILENTQNDLETLVTIGEQIGN